MNARYRTLTLVGLLVLSVLTPTVVASTGVDAQPADSDISIDHAGDVVTVANGSSQVIEGSTGLPAGSTVEVTVESTGDTHPGFFMADSASVDENGTWAVVFDFSAQPATGTFDVTVTAEGGDASATAPGEIVPCETDCADTVPKQPDTVSIDQDGDRVTVANGSTQVLSGTASEPTGTEIVVTVQSTGDTQPRFYVTNTAVVTENGTWATAFDFSDQPAGGTFSVEASTEDGVHSATVDGEIVRCGESCADTPPMDTPTPIPEQTATVTPTERGSDGDPTVTLHESAVDTVQGDTATIQLRFDGADTATVVVGSEAAGYELETVVSDADGDGNATLFFDTSLAGRDGETVSVSTGDEVRVESESRLPDALDAGEYDLTVERGDGVGEIDVGTLFVAETSSSPGTPTPAATATATPAGSDDLIGLLVSAGIVLGGGAVALVLIQR